MMIIGDGLRESTRYLAFIPLKFGATVCLVFVALYAVFKYIEYQSCGTDPHNDLAFYLLIMAALAATDGLVMMGMEYTSMRQSENRIKRYLKKIMNDGTK